MYNVVRRCCEPQLASARAEFSECQRLHARVATADFGSRRQWSFQAEGGYRLSEVVEPMACAITRFH